MKNKCEHPVSMTTMMGSQEHESLPTMAFTGVLTALMSVRIYCTSQSPFAPVVWKRITPLPSIIRTPAKHLYEDVLIGPERLLSVYRMASI